MFPLGLPSICWNLRLSSPSANPSLNVQSPAFRANHWPTPLGTRRRNRIWGTISYYRRKFRSQTSDNMDRWKAEQGRGREKRKIRREKIREEQESEKKKMQKNWEKLGNGVQTICEIYGKIWTCFIHERCLLGYPQFQGFLILAREVIWGWGMASVLSSNIHTFLPTSNH